MLNSIFLFSISFCSAVMVGCCISFPLFPAVVVFSAAYSEASASSVASEMSSILTSLSTESLYYRAFSRTVWTSNCYIEDFVVRNSIKQILYGIERIVHILQYNWCQCFMLPVLIDQIHKWLVNPCIASDILSISKEYNS